MDDTIKHRIIGGVILAASAAIFIPIFFKSSHPVHQAEKHHEFEIPSTPAQPDIAFEDSPKAAETMEPINELADSAAAKPAEPPQMRVDVANTADLQPPPMQVQAQAAQTPAAPAQQSLPQPQIQARTNVPAPAVAPQLAVNDVPAASLKQQLAEEEPTVEETVAAAPSVQGPTEQPIKKPKLAKVAHPKPVVAKAKKTNKTQLASVEHHTHPHVFVPAAAHVKPHVVKAPSAIALPAVASNGNWVVQCASFASNEHAQALQAKLAAAGFHAYLKNAQTSTGAITRVLVGPQNDRPAALAVQNQLIAKANTKGIVVNTTTLNG